MIHFSGRRRVSTAYSHRLSWGGGIAVSGIARDHSVGFLLGEFRTSAGYDPTGFGTLRSNRGIVKYQRRQQTHEAKSRGGRPKGTSRKTT